jgi:hypothetical protein
VAVLIGERRVLRRQSALSRNQHRSQRLIRRQSGITLKARLSRLTVSKRVIVDGKDVPGFMGAMTMPYPVADDQTLNRVRTGDQITADIAAGSDMHLDNVVVVKASAKK